MKFLRGVLRVLKNKYLLVLVFFAVWMAFFDPKDLGVILERREKLNDLEKSEKVLKKQISEARKELHLLKTNAETIEKYAREKYMMKRDNEDIFIVKSR